MTYTFTIYYIDTYGAMSKMKMREHSYSKVRRKFNELYPQYTIVSVR